MKTGQPTLPGPGALGHGIMGLGVFVLYYLSARLGLALAFPPDYISAIWPPNAVLLAALLLTPRRTWPLWLLAAVPAEIAADMTAGIAPALALKFVTVDGLEVLVAAGAFRYLQPGGSPLDGVEAFLRYAACAVLLAPLVAGLPGAIITGGDPAAPPFLWRWQRWLLGDALTHLIVTPTVLAVSVRSTRHRIRSSPARIAEITVLTAGFVLSTVAAFSGTVLGAGHLSGLLYLPLPFFLWSTLRFSRKTTLSFSLAFSIYVIWIAARGRGPFVNLGPAGNVANIQIFLILLLFSVIILALAIFQRSQADDRLRTSLVEKEILLKEIHHRVKNNLQVISGLLDLQASHVDDEGVLKVLKESRSRVINMALLHEKLYQSADFARLDFAGYLRTLVHNLFLSYGVGPEKVRLELRSDLVEMGLDTAIPCALIVNELVTNSLRHAFPGHRTGCVRIELSREDGGGFRLHVADDGVGLPPDFDLARTGSLGMRLVMMLAEQLGAEVELSGTKGLACTFRFREYFEAGTALQEGPESADRAPVVGSAEQSGGGRTRS